MYIHMFTTLLYIKSKIQSLFLPILESLFCEATIYTYITVHAQYSKKKLCTCVASRAANACVQGCSIHISAAVYFVENCSLYYLSVEICVATIQNLQPLDAENYS